MKVGSCIHHEELRSTLSSILSLYLLFMVHWLLSSFYVKVTFSETGRAIAMKLGLCRHLERLRSNICSILRLDLLFMVH